MENKLTAVEWLNRQIADLIPNDIGSQLKFKNKVEQAKQMEKEQIVEAWYKRGNTIVPRYYLKENINGEQYYNETYGK